MITVHNLQASGVSKPIRSSIINDTHLDEKGVPTGPDGWQAYSGKSTITWPSPTATNEKETVSAERLKNSNMDIINRARYCDIAIGQGADDISRVVAKTGNTYLLSASAFGNWRKKDINCFGDISQRIMLEMDERPKPNYSITYDTTTAQDSVLKNKLTDMVSKASDMVNTVAATVGALSGNRELAEAAVTGERASLYKDFPVIKLSSVKTNSSPGDITFKFRFGQAGIFSGEEEVVKPILALIGPWALKTGDYHSVMGPFPTESQISRKAILKTLDVIGNDASLLKQDASALKEDDSDAVTKMLKSFNGMTDKIYRLVDEVAEECFSTATTITFIVGGLVMGPYFPKNIKWDFNFDNVDEYGYPCEGSFTFGDLTPIRLQVNSDYARQWGYNVNLIDSKNIINNAQAMENALDKQQTAAVMTGSVDDGLPGAKG